MVFVPSIDRYGFLQLIVEQVGMGDVYQGGRNALIMDKADSTLSIF